MNLPDMISVPINIGTEIISGKLIFAVHQVKEIS